jgi:3D (Asp-Asp-Asp) domain-containing protein
MQHKRHYTVKRLKRRYKRLAAALAGVALLAGAPVPGIPAAIVHASATPSPGTAPDAFTQQVGDTNMAALKTTENGAPAEYKQELSITATAYAPGPHDNAQWGNKTYLGTQIRPGIIAVDPRVIPLGSRVYIQYPDGHGDYAIAEDTGGAIKGNRIDIAKTSVKEAQDFGIQHVKVFVINSPSKAKA